MRVERSEIRGHPFLASTKNDQFFDPPTPTIHRNEQQIYYLKTIESANTDSDKFQDSPIPLPCRRHKCMVPHLVPFKGAL